ncbi:gamma carbonic anhydrase family protein [Sedimentibacter sp. MB31-C6]|uniref:gamma carbonic anhydrase family protein n=1 Tax=Sedimentibacter sp. MB31-C6 TaxID=3109366 RepID=UPI002DDCF88A|nr:gamma carbonic anhydrase family protein [Sedimentibacter sp. MB36-C1]WSI04838.1 gamma carbonic anhydrase family protein [Sedimentibacter sp. MB36-C1]
MIKEFQGVFPEIDKRAYIADGAQVIGAVTLEEYCSIWYNTVIRGDVNSIKIGKYTNIQDNSVVHVEGDNPTIIGDYVTVGHGAIIHGCVIEDHCLIGMGSVILNGAVIGRGSIIAAGAVVKENAIIPPFSMVVGIPGKVIKTIPEKIDNIHAQAVKYKTLWTKQYGILPNAGGEIYNNEDII